MSTAAAAEKSNTAAQITAAINRLDAAVSNLGERVDMSAESAQAKLDTLVETVAALRTEIEALKAARPANTNAYGGGQGGGGGSKYAPGNDADLDGKFGDPVIDRKPPRWEGPWNEGQPMSKQDPEFLRSYAGFQEWRARKSLEEGKGENKYAVRDAARARAWADRLERGVGHTPRPVDGTGKSKKAPITDWDDTPPADEQAFEDEIPF